MTTPAIEMDGGREICPAWCDVPDHSGRDGGGGSHAAHDHVVNLSRTVQDDPDDHDVIYVGLHRAAGQTDPYIALVASLEDGDHEMQLTADEAELIAAGLTLMARKFRTQVDEDDMFRRLSSGLVASWHGSSP
jgi:hypothetical protein